MIGFWLLALLSGCSSIFTSPVVRVVASPPPPVASDQSLPVLANDDSKLPLILSEKGRFTQPNILKFFAAREAFWNYDTETAVKLLRELRKDNVMSADHFHNLVLQCYERDGRWTEILPLIAEFGIEESQAERLKFARFMSSLPPRRLEFTSGAPPVPIALRLGDSVHAEGEINGMKARLVLDTGCGLSWVSERFARRAGVEVLRQTIALNDANGRTRETPMALMRELRLGGLTVRNMPVLVGDSLFVQLFEGVDGIIGWDVLQHGDVTWDFPGKLMTLAAPGGPVSSQPNLAGRIGPILTVLSFAGRPLQLFLDTGAHGNRRTCMTVWENEGVLATKLPIAEFRPSWLPTLNGAMHSLVLNWPRRARPFSFWMDGYRFEMTAAALKNRDYVQEQLVYVDGVVGNLPFLSGKLRVCGVRREAGFEISERQIAAAAVAHAEAAAKKQIAAAAVAHAEAAVMTGQPNARSLLTEAAIAITTEAEDQRKLRFLRTVLDPAPPINLAAVAGDSVFLSDVGWSSAKVGWGQPARNHCWFDDNIQDGVFLVLGGQFFEKGLFAHSPSRYVFEPGGEWKTFTAMIGLRDGANDMGSAVFMVRGDGRQLYRSPILRPGSHREVNVDIAGIKELELVAESGEAHNYFSWAIWAEPMLRR